jgi:L-ascorbate metabolism protein UlaG (beta-lactamase superfamily)
VTVSLEWFGCATFRVRTGSSTLFFDTYLDKAPGVPPAGLSAADVDRADFLFISHAHFDHVLGADAIAIRTGATVVGNHETAHLMSANGVPDAQVLPVSGGETVDCGDGVTVRVLPALHSCLFAGAAPDSGSSCLGDLGVSAQERRDRTSGLFDLMSTLSDPLRRWFDDADAHASARDGGQLAYLLDSPDGSLLVSASSGHWTGIFAGLRPDVAILAAMGRPNVDGEPHQGSLSDFLVEQVGLLGNPAVILCHHDALLPPFLPAVDVSEAERRLRDLLGPDRYLTLSYGEPVDLERGVATRRATG